MTAVGKLAPPKKLRAPKQECRDQLAYWREHWLEWKDGTSNRVLTREHIWSSLDRWLEELCEDLGLQWKPRTAKEKRLMTTGGKR